MPSLFYAGQPDYIEKLNTLATAASMTNGTVAASFLSLAVTGTATAASFVGPLTGNASTATTLATARNINGVSFNGSADITVTAAAGTLTGNTLAAGVTASSLTSVGTLTALTVSGTSTLGVTRASAADGAITFGVAGTTRGVRILTSSYGTAIEGVDNTLVGSYQPLNVIATTLGLYTTGGGNVQIGTGSNLTQFSVTHTASAVNYFQVTGAPTTGQPGLISTGTDANVSSAFSTKGTGYHYFSTNSFADVQFVIASVPSAVNRLQVQGGTAGFGPTIYVDGADTNTQLTISSKGTGSVLISTNTAGSIALQALHVASAVNWVRVQGSATGVASFVSVQGADTNASIVVAAKGSGAVGLYTGGGVNPQVLVTHTASAVNYAQITGAVTGSGVRYGVDGSDSNITWAASSKGTFGLGLYTNSFSQLQFAVGHIASAVNYLLVQGSGTGLNPALIAQGSDANIGVTIASKGSGNVGIYTGAGAVGSFFVTHTASGVNWVQTTGSTTGNAVSMTAGGSDTNIDFLLGGKGTGVLRFGAHSALAAETVTGYITVKDSAGNTRKLAVVS